MDLRSDFDPTLPIEAARTPPTSWYLRPEFHERELASVFGSRWHFAARVEQLTAPGAFVATEVGDQPIVVVRGEEGELRAFHNVCRHHAACVMQGAGTADALVCPYHGWTYGLDGALRTAPAMGRIDGFDRDAMGLPSAAVAAWGPFVFVSLAEQPGDLHAELAPLNSLLEASGWGDLQYYGSGIYELECNWKVYVDNYLDGGYHIAHAHKSLDAELDMADYRTECHDTWCVQLCADSGSDRLEGGAIYAWLHPNFMINRYGPIMDTNLVVPRGHDRCEVRYDYWFREVEGADAEVFIRESLAQTDRIQQEDIALCANVQRGMRSVSYDRGVYAKSETGMYQFHRLLAGDLLTAE